MSCSSCRIDLSETTFIHCAECRVPSVSLCILCFSGKFEDPEHRSDHDYYVMLGDSLQEEQLLSIPVSANHLILEHIRRASVGSWDSQSDRLSSLKVEDVEKAALSLYEMWNLEGIDHGKYRSNITSTALDVFGGVREGGMVLETIHAKSESGDIPGFLPKRKDFEMEYDDTAELAIADLEFYDDDSAQDHAIKCALLHTLNERLRRREWIKEFAISTGMVCSREKLECIRAATYQQTEMEGKLRPVHRFFTDSTELNDFVSLCLYEARLRARISALADGEVIESEETADTEEIMGHVRRNTSVDTGSRKPRVADSECGKISDLFMNDQVMAEVIGKKRFHGDGTTYLSPADLSLIEELVLGQLTDGGFSSGEMILTHQGDTINVHANGIQ